ncbi:dolichyl-phosphate beta-glucosyltransferase [Anabrus simplex]|uniref:dolichyl-phosphate beta-glucosyltransferase n=1 Tax=Anabrus simplex TaxID=316456 RepID=UPI0034DD0811
MFSNVNLSIYELFCNGMLGLFFLFITCCVYVYLTSSRVPIVYVSDEERHFYDPRTKKRCLFPSINDQWSDERDVHLSVIIPAFNEEHRLPPMLDECLVMLHNRLGLHFRYEVIVVSDGSNDHTVDISRIYAQKYGSRRFRIMELVANRGKGGAVRLGIQSARGAVLLLADADGATRFEDLLILERHLKSLIGVDYRLHPDIVARKVAIVCGSRAHLEKRAKATRSYFRTLLMYGFHCMVWLFAVRGIRDTQCGFKLLTRAAARICFASLHVEGWAFDVEMLYIAQKLKIPVSEVAVNWTEIKGSKIIPVFSWIQMGKDVFMIWFKYRIGAWTLYGERD